MDAVASAIDAVAFVDRVSTVAVPRARLVVVEFPGYTDGELDLRDVPGAARTCTVATDAVQDHSATVHGHGAGVPNVPLAAQGVLVVRRITRVAQAATVSAEASGDGVAAVTVEVTRRVTNSSQRAGRVVGVRTVSGVTIACAGCAVAIGNGSIAVPVF